MMHAARVRRHGVVNPSRQTKGPAQNLVGKRFGMLLVVKYAQRSRWRVVCDCGVEKLVEGGSLRSGQTTSCGCNNPIKKIGEGHPRWQGKNIAYSTAHKRVAARRGPAKTHNCIECGKPAHSWAYRGNSPEELTFYRPEGESHVKTGLLRYSPNPDDYDPMCWACHSRKDVLEARTRP